MERRMEIEKSGKTERRRNREIGRREGGREERSDRSIPCVLSAQRVHMYISAHRVNMHMYIQYMYFYIFYLTSPPGTTMR